MIGEMALMSVDEIVRELRERAAEHRSTGWELMREGDPGLLERAANSLEMWKSIADGRLEQSRINHDAYEKLRAEVEGRHSA